MSTSQLRELITLAWGLAVWHPSSGIRQVARLVHGIAWWELHRRSRPT